MKNLRKVLAVMLALMLVLGMAMPVMAATPSEISTYASNLYNLGLYAGVDPSGYVPALEDSLTREQAFVLFAKIMGKAERAADVDKDDIKAYLDDVFTDADQFSDWAKPFATILVMDKDVSGRGDFTMGPKDIIKGSELGVLMLKAMKEPMDYNTSVYACVALWNMGIITFSESAGLNEAQLTRGDAITIFWKTIANGKIKDGDYIAKFLCDAGVMSESSARAVGLLDTYDAAVADGNASAATTAAEEAVAALQSAKYATEEDFVAYKALLAEAEAKIAAAPEATRAAFTARVNVKKELVANALAAQVSAAELAVSKYTDVKKITTVKASLAAIALKEAAIAKVNAIVDPASRVSLLASIEATREVLEATKLLDLTSDRASVVGNGKNEIILKLELKDAIGTVIEDAPATTVKLSTDEFGTVSSKEVTLYDGVATVLFAGTELDAEDDSKTSIITAAVNDDFAKATVTLEIDVTQAPSYENKLKAASMPKNLTDRIVLTFENDVNLDELFSFGPESDIQDKDVAIDKNKKPIIVADPTSAKKVVVFLASDTTLNFKDGDKVTVQIADEEVEFKVEDIQKPYIVSAKVNPKDYKQIEVTFSEPIRVTEFKTAFLNGDWLADSYKADGNKLTLTFDDYVKSGNAVITIAADSIQDFCISNNVNAAQSKVFNIAKPDVKLGASVEVLSKTMIALKMNTKSIVSEVELQVYNYDEAEWTSDDMPKFDTEKVDEENILLVLKGEILNYKNRKYRIRFEEETLQDIVTGVKNEKSINTDEFTIAEDKTKPKVESVKVKEDKGDYKVTVKFSEPIDTKTVVIEIKEKITDGDDITVKASKNDDFEMTWDKYRMELKFTLDDLDFDTEYYAVIKKDFKDDTGDNKGSEYKSDVFETDVEVIDFEIDSATDVIKGEFHSITVKFTKDLALTEDNITNALYLGNYRYDAGAGYTYFDETKSVIFMEDSETVVILVAGEIVGIKEIIVSDLVTAADGAEFEDDDARTSVVVAE